MFQVAKTLRNVKDNIMVWNKMEFGNIFEAKDGLHSEIIKIQITIQK